ncbi:MAG: hypothetical protein MEQ07_12055 [Aquimonas sp.]|nr:hypothetical protein [Aquimonas sp.]
MTPEKIAHRLIKIGQREIRLDYEAKQIEKADDLLLVLLDPDAEGELKLNYRNLLAFRLDGSLAWIAEQPTNAAHDVYYRIIDTSPIRALAFTSWSCTIDKESGRVVNREFFK